METSLAIYEALLQANVPAPAARRAAESLEKDMTTTLATKQDLQHLEGLTSARFDALEDKLSLQMQNFELRIQALESRVVIRLSAVMVALVALAGTLLAFFR